MFWKETLVLGCERVSNTCKRSRRSVYSRRAAARSSAIILSRERAIVSLHQTVNARCKPGCTGSRNQATRDATPRVAHLWGVAALQVNHCRGSVSQVAQGADTLVSWGRYTLPPYRRDSRLQEVAQSNSYSRSPTQGGKTPHAINLRFLPLLRVL